MAISVLYVDDDVHLLQVTKLFLEQQNGDLEVDTAVSAVDALKRMEQKTYDAIVSDYEMPGTNGIDFLRSIRKQQNTLPFIIYTGRSREEIVIQAINEGADFYLQKGGDPEAQFAELSHKIRQAVGRQQAETRRVESEKRLTDIIDFLPDATFAIDRAGSIIAWNRAIEKMSGRPASEMLGRGDYEYAIPIYGERRPILIDLIFRSDEEISPNYSNISREGESVTAETDVLLPTGKKITLLVKATPLYNQQGELTGAIESIRDITERKRAEEALRQSERRLSFALEATSDGLWDWDLATDHVYWSPRAFEMLGYVMDEFPVTFAVWKSLLHPDDRDATERNVMIQLKEGQQFSAEFRCRKKDGSWKWILGRGRAVAWDAQGKVTRMVGTHVDLTGLKEAQAALLESEKRYERIDSSSRDTIYSYDRDGRFTHANHALCRLLGLSRDEIIGRTHAELGFPQAQCEEWSALQDQVYATGETVIRQTVTPIQGGQVMYFEVVLNPIRDTAGTITGISGFSRDITERKRAEEALVRKNDELAASNEQFTASEDELRLSREILKAVLDSVPVRIFWKDRDMKYLGCNAPFARDAGFERPEDLIGKDDFAMGWREQAELYRTDDRFVIESGTPRLLIEEPQTTPSGEIIHLLTSKIPLRNADGTIGGVLGTYLDITESKKIEEELLREKTIIDAIFNSVPGIIYLYNAEGHLVRWNKKHELMTGYTPQELSRMQLLDWYKGDERSQNAVLESVKTTMQNGFGEAEADLQTKDGTKIPMYFTACPLTIGGKQYFAGLGIDITERRKAENAVRTSEELYRSVIENIQDIYYRSDRDGNLIMVSPSAAAAFGYDSVDEILGKSIAETLYFDSAERAGFLAELQKTGSVSNYQTRLKKKDGTMRYVLTNSHYYHDQSGAVAGVEGILRDITDRKAAEEALQRSEERYRNVVENAGEAIVVAKGGDRLVYANPMTITILKTIPEEILSRPFTDFIHPGDRALVYERHQRRMRGEDVPKQYDFRLVDGTGETIWVTISPVLILWDGEPATLNFLQDITVRKRAEEALRESNKKLKLLSSITRHDITNQLMLIRTYIALLKKDQPDPAIGEKYREILTATGQAEAMILFTKEYENIGVNTPVWQDLRALGERTAEEAKPGQVQVRIDLPPGTEVFADPMIGKVFHNLIDNAVRHGGKISRIRFFSEDTGGDHVIICDDDGAGIAHDEKEKIFERGFGKNTGMGLFLAREILAITGITIRETGEPGKGARFEMVVPKEAWRDNLNGGTVP